MGFSPNNLPFSLLCPLAAGIFRHLLRPRHAWGCAFRLWNPADHELAVGGRRIPASQRGRFWGCVRLRDGVEPLRHTYGFAPEASTPPVVPTVRIPMRVFPGNASAAFSPGHFLSMPFSSREIAPGIPSLPGSGLPSFKFPLYRQKPIHYDKNTRSYQSFRLTTNFHRQVTQYAFSIDCASSGSGSAPDGLRPSLGRLREKAVPGFLFDPL